MKVTYNWLKDFVLIEISPSELAKKLTMAGLEVTSLEEKEGDFIFEMEITSNRPDLLSVFGIAQEVAAITGKKLKVGARCSVFGIRYSGKCQTLEIKIEDKKDCPLYTAQIIRNVKVGPSPEWLRKRLELIGCRSVNNLVDITNYILFSWGEPLHAFDLDKLKSNIIFVRRAKAEEKIITLDNEERTLNPEILVIADEEKSLAVAGIMGGRDTEVTEETKNVLLEAAIFNPTLIRRARQKLGLSTESSYRFERGLSLLIVEIASQQAVKLIQKLCGGRLIFLKKIGKLPSKKVSVYLDCNRVNKVLGTKISSSHIQRILKNLSFKIEEKKKDKFFVEVPPYRLDIKLEMDLVEEIARIYGYEKIPADLPKVIPQVSFYNLRDLVLKIKQILTGLGLQEVITYSLINRDLISFLKIEPKQVITIVNPLNKEQEILRPSLISGLANCIAYNLNQKQNYIRIFEIAKRFFLDGSSLQEELTLGLALCGQRSVWQGENFIQEKVSFLNLKGILEVIFSRLGINEYKFIAQENKLEIDLYIKELKIGKLRKLEKEFLDYLDIKNKAVFVAEISLEKILSFAKIERKFKSLPRYPGIWRDISLVVKEEVPLEKIKEVIFASAGSMLEEIELIDYYKGKQIEPNFKGLTLSLGYRCLERTLTEAEIIPIHENIIQALKEKLNARIR